VPYYVLGGDQSAAADHTASLLSRLQMRATMAVTGLAFFHTPNDVQVTVQSATALPEVGPGCRGRADGMRSHDLLLFVGGSRRAAGVPRAQGRLMQRPRRDDANLPSSYAELRLSVGSGVDGYPLQVSLRDPEKGTLGRQEMSRFIVPVQSWEVDAVSSRLVVKQSTSQSIETSDPARDVGSRMFEAVFSGPGARVYAEAIEKGVRQRQGLCIRVAAHDPEIVALPWELLFDRSLGRDFVALTPTMSVVRDHYEGDTESFSPPAESLPIVLAGIPKEDVEGLQLQPSEVAHQDAKLGWDSLKNLIEVTRPRALHVRVESVPDQSSSSAPVVRLGDDLLQTRDLLRLVTYASDLQLVVLDGGDTDILAVELAARVQVVVGFRGWTAPSSSAGFLRQFYDAVLHRGLSIPAAVAAARGRLAFERPGESDWAAAVVSSATLGAIVKAPEAEVRPPSSTAVQQSVGTEARSPADSLRAQIELDQANLEALNEQWSEVALHLRPAIVQRQIDKLDTRIAENRKALKDLS
jgi:hypothetical protein